MKIKKIGSIKLLNSLWWTNHNDVTPIIAETVSTIDGGVVVFELEAQITAQNIQLSSLENGWLSIQNKNDIIDLINAGNTTTITTDDDDEIDVRFRYENSNPAKFTRLVQAKDSIYYTIDLALAKI